MCVCVCVYVMYIYIDEIKISIIELYFMRLQMAVGYGIWNAITEYPLHQECMTYMEELMTGRPTVIAGYSLTW